MKTGKVSDTILFALLLFAGFGLFTGMFAGLVRLGWHIEGGSPVSPLAHGPFMINGFLATLIGLERAAALGKKWSYIAPVSIAVSTILLLFGYSVIGKCLLVFGSFFLFLVLAYLYKLQPETYHLIMALGGASLWAGNILFLLGFPIYNLVGWWIGFPLLTIFGERLELNRIMRPPKKARALFTGLVFLWIAGVAFTYIDRHAGWAVASVALIMLALWLFKYDIARRTIHSSQWTRYSAVCLLTGYGWLILAGLFGIWKGFPAAGAMYDALLHMIFVGFVFSMIFAHASVIIPSLTGRLIPYHKFFYLPLILLHVSLLTRVIGDLQWDLFIRKSGAHSNVLAILLFISGILYQLNRNSLTRKKRLNKMAKPISRTFDQTKDSVINVFPEAAKELGMPMIGCNYELGMLSFGEEGKAVFHAHIVEQKDRSTRVEIAPGLSFMKDRPQSEMPTSTIDNIMDKLSTTLKSERNR